MPRVRPKSAISLFSACRARPVVPRFKPIVDAREAFGLALLRLQLLCLRIWVLPAGLPSPGLIRGIRCNPRLTP